jgi:xyloglucan-specific exo-beta-1,4-glucanase
MKKPFFRFLAWGATCLLVLSVSLLTQPPVTLHAQATALEMQYMTSHPDTSVREMRPDFQLVNNGSDSISLSQVTLRYWFTRDTAEPVSVACNYVHYLTKILPYTLC